MIDKIKKLEFDNEEFFILEGKISELQIAKSSQNLLEKIDGRIKGGSIAVGTVAALTDMHGVLANSLTLSLYDGEDLFNFAGLVEGYIVFGSFSKADKIKNEDKVRIVVSKRGEALYVHSLLKLEDHLLLLPLMVFSGDKAFFRSCMKFAWRCCLLVWTFLIVCLYFSLDQKFYSSDKVVFVAILVFVLPLFFFPFEYRSYKSMRYYGLYGSAIFKAYDLPRPDDIDIRSGMTHYKDESYGFGGINLETALEGHRKKYGIN
ncbi:hypothetical protein SAMN05428959_1144 [Duganella sp. CF517]|uniref:hypothetical protein n=1 Tax=Duganella sp. CF517 TaxID=1881038 RepID=UPI0008D487AC|nr:hypothetical protein [Duganella sp. CF517]SEO63405.1 hypothetical protein SAMN05428959_1144 [Duganella sp. CF517]